MTTVTTNTKVQLSSLVSLRLVNFVEATFAAYKDWKLARRTYKDLSNLSDPQLNDIGLTRADIQGIFDR